MVVCSCRKATRIYCYVHTAALCGDCICNDEHKICVVRTYPEWVLNPDYQMPQKCRVCDEEIRQEQAVTRLGCLHILHSSCLESHLKSFPEHTAPAGYVCPECSTAIWPPSSKHFRQQNVGLALKLKDSITKAGLAGALLGSDSSSDADTTSTPFSTMPLVSTVAVSDRNNAADQTVSSVSEISAVDEPSSTASTSANTSPSPSVSSQMANSIARKNSYRPDKVVIGSMPYVGDDEDEDGISRKYARRGPFYKQLLTHIIPFWSPALPTLPVTNPSLRKDGEEELHSSRRRHHRHSTADPRNILFVFAILSCIATMLLLYYRLIQSSALATA